VASHSSTGRLVGQRATAPHHPTTALHGCGSGRSPQGGLSSQWVRDETHHHRHLYSYITACMRVSLPSHPCMRDSVSIKMGVGYVIVTLPRQTPPPAPVPAHHRVLRGATEGQFACMAVGDLRVLQHECVVVANSQTVRASLKRVAKPLPRVVSPRPSVCLFMEPAIRTGAIYSFSPSAHISSSSTHAACASTPHVGGGHSDSVWVCLCVTAVLTP
jgi:hypothetical protein